MLNEMVAHYPIPYLKDLVINAPQGAEFRFDLLTSVISEDEWLKLDDRGRLTNVWNVIKELETSLGIKVQTNVILDENLA